MYNDLTTKVLANENINVIRKNVQTAAFDLENRTVILPNWKDITEDVESLLSYHEVSHALFTPTEYVQEVKSNPSIRSYMNVLEDIRVEKLFKEKYPGSRKTFTQGYKQLGDKDFFGIENTDVNELNIIDRINIYHKIGISSGIKFKRNEKSIMERIHKMITFDDVKELAFELFEKQKDEDEELEKEYNDISEGEGYIEEDTDDNDEVTTTEGETTTEEDTDDTEEETYDESNDTDSNQTTQSEPVSTTQKNFDEKLNQLSDPEYDPLYVTLDDTNDTSFITYKEIMHVLNENSWVFSDNNSMAQNFKKESNKQVNHIAQQFELKKAADNYKKEQISKTGVIDPVKLASYKIKKDIFKKNTVIPDGQNHGMIMLLDWSGSMNTDNKLDSSLKQAIQLALFCKKVNIPFRIIGFSTSQRYFQHTGGSECVMLELLTSEMNNKDFNFMLKSLLDRNFTYLIKLGRTPLAPALKYLDTYIPQFKQAYKIDKISLISFTDGGNTHNTIGVYNPIQDNFIVDPVTKKNFKTYTPDGMLNFNISQCNALYEMLKYKYDLNIISFMVISTREFTQGMRFMGITQIYESYKLNMAFKKEKYVQVNAPGRDKGFIIDTKMLTTDGKEYDITGEMTSRKISRQLLKQGKNTLKNKIILDKFIEIIA